MELLLKTLTAFLLGVVLTGALLFVPAGTLIYSGAWLFVALLFVPIFIVGVVLWVKNPDLLAKRLAMKEREQEQRGIVALSGVMLVASFVLAGVDFRFGWSRVPLSVVALGSVVLLVAYGLYAEVLRENAYLSRVVEVQAGQKVVDTGLYGIVRHPMYAAVSLLYLSIPLVLGSWWALLPMAFCVVLLVLRCLHEERLLCRELEEYEAYIRKVRYRMVPLIF